MKRVKVQVVNPLEVAEFKMLLRIFEKEFEMSDFTSP